MNETFVRLLCPDCRKTWQRKPGELPRPDATLECDGCAAARPTAEYARTDHDLEVLKQFR